MSRTWKIHTQRQRVVDLHLDLLEILGQITSKKVIQKTVIVRLSDLAASDHLEAAFSNMAFNGLQCTDAPSEGRWHCWVVLFFQESIDHVNVVVLKTFIKYDTNCLMGLRNYCTQINVSPFDNESFFCLLLMTYNLLLKSSKTHFFRPTITYKSLVSKAFQRCGCFKAIIAAPLWLLIKPSCELVRVGLKA